jgi:hypothetical protein
MTKLQNKLLKNIISRLAQNNCEVVRPIPVWTEDLSKWFFTLIKTGKGFVPEISQAPAQSKPFKKE